MASTRSMMSLRNQFNRSICPACRYLAPRLPQARIRFPLSSIHSRYVSSSSVPQIVTPSFWYSMLPKFLRRTDSKPKTPQEAKSKEWNPATFFILIFMLIGSQSIRMIALRNEFTNFSQNSEAKLTVLREVIERLQKGEDVDVERLLGTGDASKEREWEEVLREIEEEESLWHHKPLRSSKKDRHPSAEDQLPPAEAPPVSKPWTKMADTISEIPPEVKEEARKPGPGSFY